MAVEFTHFVDRDGVVSRIEHVRRKPDVRIDLRGNTILIQDNSGFEFFGSKDHPLVARLCRFLESSSV
jgi:hypothetical protein